MKVRCVRNKLVDIANSKEREFIARTMRISEKAQYAITIDQEYTVYGITFWDRIPFYIVCGEDPDFKVIFVPAAYFETTDPRPSLYWNFSYKFCITAISELNFPEWTSDPWFYEKLTDGKLEELRIFNQYKALMDEEFTPLYQSQEQQNVHLSQTHSHLIH